MSRSRLHTAIAIAIALLAIAPLAAPLRAQKFEGLALTPPMGWNSWNRFGCNVSEQLIRETAQAMVSSGMRDAGYRYVNIDDCWHGARDSLGFIQPDPQRFPSGMKALADHVHSLGLKIGIYSDAGAKTCGGRPGSQGYEYQDALQYARWGIDYLKYDWCNTNGRNAPEAYRTMRDALRAAGRPIVFSICEWGDNKPWEWAKDVGHLWRTTGDITHCWDCEQNHGNWSSWGILRILDRNRGLRVHAGPGRWNDPDMLEVGNGMTTSEDRAHFTMWAMLAAPLIAGNDLRDMSAETRAILTNRELIAFNQDSLGIQGVPYEADANVEIWFKPLANGDWAMAILNRTDAPRRVTFDFAHEEVGDNQNGRDARFREIRYGLRDVWTGRDVGTTAAPLVVTVPGRDAVAYRLRKP
jgi:alpha-galactosidase